MDDVLMQAILYITYDGLTDPLGQSQILAYLKRLTSERKIIILSFEKEELFSTYEAGVRKIVDESGLTWIPLKYTKTPPVLSTVMDIRKGMSEARALIKKYKVSTVHCRGYLPAIIGSKMKRELGTRFIFDMRGWWPDEKKESGFWASPIYLPVYRYFKKLEKRFFREADYIVSLTYKGRDEMVNRGWASADKVGVIPTCVDFEIFRPRDEARKRSIRHSLNTGNGKVFIYSGSLGGNYDPNILIDVFTAFNEKFPGTFLLILSKDKIDDGIRKLLQENGITRMAIINAPFTEVSNYLQAGDVGFIYYKMSFSTIGRSPTKLGEYWASGLPVIAFSGIGDLDTIIPKYRGSGVLLGTSKENWRAELDALEFTDAATLRNYSEDYFHIDKGVAFYSDVYKKTAPIINS